MFRDLSQPIETGMPTYPGDPDVTLAPDATHEADGYATSELRTGTHAGTHVDAPKHTLPGGEPIDEGAVGRFAFEARLVDCRPLAPREAVAPEALPDPSGLDPDVDLLVLRTGWESHWGTVRYRDHPYLTAAAAERCRAADVGVALDAFGPDPTPTADARPNEDGGPNEGGGPAASNERDEPDGTPAHDALLGAALPIVENLRALDGLPDRFRLYAFPLRLRGADGSPVRAVAEWEE
ncbi:cyclase family protein [Halorubrum sp. GN11_10-6_MGM]|uniref:cyclase family protein n=1 Tax=Halorubrum sp. GN11_10-6_MGM TaxID=2518112 RepID=UPI0010F73057|nr:cyclase family protein [Halorubrum sp. GN11_10-6_MGM]TKX75280.1 cyclase family protein [Halorubrum sp. GN11_10-6_MGM]